MDLITWDAPNPGNASETGGAEINIESLIAQTQDDAVPTFGTDSNGLKKQMEHLRMELNEAYSAGSVEECIRIRGQLETMPVRIRKTQVDEAKAAISEAENEIEETNTLIEEARELRNQRQRIFAEKMDAANQAGTAVEKVNFVLWRLDLELQNHKAAVRHQQRLLQELMENKNEDF